MAFPNGWTHRVTVTVDKTKVVGTPTGAILVITKDMLPSTFIDAGATSAQNGGGDIRVTADEAGTQRLPIEVVEFVPNALLANRRCEIWVNTRGYEPSSSADTTYYVWCKGPYACMTQPYPSHASGWEAVWSPDDYRLVQHGNTSFKPEFYGLWLIRPTAVDASGSGDIFRVWQDSIGAGTGRIRIAQWSAGTGKWSAAVTIATGDLLDAHCSPSICIDTNSYLHVTWAGFNSATQKIRTVKSTNQLDISAWDAVVDVVSAGGASDRTYPCMLALPNTHLVLTYRESSTWVKKVSLDGGTTWSATAQTILTSERAYCEWQVDSNGRVHLAWHSTAAAGATNGLNINYLYSDNADSDSSTWKAIDGTAATLPLASESPNSVSTGRVFATVASGFTTSYLRGIGVDNSNNVIISCDSFVSGTPASSECQAFTYSAGAWTKRTLFTGATVGLPSTGSPNRAEGGVRWVSGNTWRMLVGIYSALSVGEVQEWESTDSGANWTKIADLTSASSRGNIHAQYVRPQSAGGTLNGKITSTWLWSSSGNKGGATINNTSDSVMFNGDATDGVAGYVSGIIAATTYLRDSTKYRNDMSVTGSPTEVDGVVGWGGKAQSVTATAFYFVATNSTLAADLTAAIFTSIWASHTTAGLAQHVSNVGGTAGATIPWAKYRDAANAVMNYFGNGSTSVNPSVAGAGSSLYRNVGKFASGTARSRINTTGASSALTGPLATHAGNINFGTSIIGKVDEMRMGPTQVSDNTLDTEYANQNSPATFATGAESPIVTSTRKRNWSPIPIVKSLITFGSFNRTRW